MCSVYTHYSVMDVKQNPTNAEQCEVDQSEMAEVREIRESFLHSSHHY
jgi:hypothetical protein